MSYTLPSLENNAGKNLTLASLILQTLAKFNKIMPLAKLASAFTGCQIKPKIGRGPQSPATYVKCTTEHFLQI